MATRRRAHQGTGEDELNQINLEMRQSPWYQDWFSSQGLNPNKVKLNDNQRNDLMNLAMQQGYELGDRMKVDEAGNFNQKGGFAGMPTAAKWAIGAAPVAGAMLIPGVREAVLSNMGTIFGAGGGSGVTGGAGSTGIAGLNAATLTSIPGVTTGVGGTLAGTGAGLTTVGPTAAGGGASKWLGKIFGKDGLDPTALALGGMSLLGGEEVDDPKLSLRGTSADPVMRMTEALDAIKNMTSGLQERGPIKLRSSYVPEPPSPVSIPGIPFQIGGGLGRDPALKDPSLLEGQAAAFPDLFGGPGSALPRDMNPNPRKPNNNG